MRNWTARSRAAARKACETFGLRVECLACGTPQRFYPGGPRRLRATPCENPLCGEISLRSVYWIKTHPELAAQAKRHARALVRVHEA